MLTVIGDLVEDVVVWTAGPLRHGTDNPATIRRSRGGSAANVAAIAAPLVPTRFIGRVGDDTTGRALVEALSATGVDVRVQRGGRTGTVVITVDPIDGERTMYPDRGAATDLAPVPDAWLAQTRVLHVPAYGLAVEPAATSILGAAATARRHGAAVTIDVSAVTVVEALGAERLWPAIESIRPEVVFANADEADALGLVARRPWPGATWVVKDGARPARVITDDGASVAVDAEPVATVRDTTGAGDAFAAGFLAARLRGADPVAACRAGHRSAATVLATPGAG